MLLAIAPGTGRESLKDGWTKDRERGRERGRVSEIEKDEILTDRPTALFGTRKASI